jgi:TIR domain
MGGIGRLMSLRKTVFIAHAGEDKTIAKDIALRLRRGRFDVFLDRDVLEAGESYDDRIRRQIRGSDALIFLVSPDSIRDGKYTRSELAYAEAVAGSAWPGAAGGGSPDRRQADPLLPSCRHHPRTAVAA